MKIAISVPDAVGRAADRVARRLGMPRSQLYARAVEEYVRRLEGADVTARLDAVYAGEPAEVDGFTQAAARAMLKRAKW
jgi:predicted transcriptional regulator